MQTGECRGGPMQLTKYSDYALRVLLFLGQHPDRRTTIDDLAGHYRISRNHLTKIVHQLSLAGFIKSTRGRSGGLTLGAAPDAIIIADVIRHTEKKMALVECFETGSTCTIEPDCVLKYVLQRAQDSFMEVLSLFSLADILDRQKLLAAKAASTLELKIPSKIGAAPNA
jgi:Rrf2 family nitric oxide-sensitive transcriptional repressor